MSGGPELDHVERSAAGAARAELTVVVPSYRSVRTLEHCLASLRAQRTGRHVQVIVVHSGEREQPLAAELIERNPDVEFRVSGERELPGRARNWAARTCGTPWVLFLDSDCIAPAGWIDAILTVAERGGAIAVGGAVANGAPLSPWAWAAHLLEFGDWLPGRGVRPIENFPSCNALYRRAALLAAGGFPEDLFPAEDSVLNQRLRAAGGRLLFAAEATVRHLPAPGWRALLHHQYVHGAAFARACEEYGLAASSRAPRHAWLRAAAAVAARSVLVPVRIARTAPRALPLCALLLPWLAASLCAWAAGSVVERARRAALTGALASRGPAQFPPHAANSDQVPRETRSDLRA